MYTTSRQWNFNKQHGAALMLMLTILVIGAAALLVSSLSRSALQIERDLKTAAALAQAKEAIIGYAITYGDTHPGEVHGFLPCPDTVGGNPEGSAELNCGEKTVSQLGRLPWKTLGLPMLRDGNGECLWYAVSGTYKNNPKADLMNRDNPGLLEIRDANGVIAAQNVVAVVLAPGASLNNQNRTADGTAPFCGGNYIAANYLDGNASINNAMVSGTANAVSQFRLAAPPQSNDQMIFITGDDIWNALSRRNDFLATLNNMTQKVAECIADFGKKNKIGVTPDYTNKSLPWPARIALSDYGNNANYNSKKDLYAGRVPYQVNRLTSGNASGSDYLLTQGSCDKNGTNCVNNCPDPDSWANLYFPLWDNWKDHLFYALGQEFHPDNAPTSRCGNCLKVNSSGKYAAVVIFAGQKISPANRSGKNIVAAYLEGRNASNLNAAKGGEDYQNAAVSSTFNDILFCIKEDLSVIPCP